MSIHIWLAFVLTASLILIVPGPSIIYVVGQSLKHGRRASLPLSIGVILGDALCIALSLLGLSVFLSVFSTAFILIKYLGAGYLIYLGVKMFRSSSTVRPQQIDSSDFDSKKLFKDVFLVNALNPKGIVFYSAFMPQFVVSQSNVVYQFSILAITFLCLAFINVTFYSFLASKTIQLFKKAKFLRAFNVTGGLFLVGAGLYTATVKRN
ncbi:LysE family translocator [Vibrio sp. CAIM 722]|uniref:LysE family translocator n=1 Tax=Vibrio eleionomae TaxID=2653505 RepID=A0A7X4RTT9_9VIBR|nr:LysE family translocator [Vibrio eleionomae]MZI93186.1 LysE family translocator [Vibrio eleionomae]